MEYQNIENLLGKPNNQLSKFRTRNWVGVSDYSNGTNEAGKQIKFYTWMLMPSLCDYSDAYILVKATLTITRAGAGAAAKNADTRNKEITFKNFVPFTKYNQINNTQVGNAGCPDTVMPMRNLIDSGL